MPMEQQFIRSERAHFMCPNMHFGILAEIKAKADLEKIRSCLNCMAKAHPFLRSVIKYDRDQRNLYYEVGERSMITIYEKLSIENVWEDYREIGEKEWNVFEHGLLKVLIYQDEDAMTLLLVSHHLLGDGRCLLELVNEFVQLYVEQKQPAYAPERLIRGMEDLPAGSDLPRISRSLVRHMNKKWRKEKTTVTYEEYAKFSEEFVAKNPVSYESKAVEPEKLRLMKAVCKEHDITINDFLMANVYQKLGVNKIIIAADVRNQLNCYQKGACGNYATAMGIVCKTKAKDVYKIAKEVHKQVKLHRENNQKLMLILSCYLNMDQTLIDAAAIGTLGNFKSKAARFVGTAMFGYGKRDGVSITNLGRIANSNIRKAAFIPPASPAARRTIGVLTVNDRMQICSSFYER